MIAIVSLAAMPFLERPVAADTNTDSAGQPNQSCQSSFLAGPLSPAGFNTNCLANADTPYAGNGQTTQNPANLAAVAQYDAACFQATKH